MPNDSGYEPNHDSKREHWRRYQEQHRRVLERGMDRLGDAVDFWVDALKEHAAARIGWGKEILEQREYPLKRIVPDMLTFTAAAVDTAMDWARFLSEGSRGAPAGKPASGKAKEGK